MLWILFTGNIWLLVMLYIFITEVYKSAPSNVSRMLSVVTTPASLFALCTGLLLTYMYSGVFIEISISAAFIGAGSGIMFGSLYNRDAAITGAGSGFMAGIMAPMLGEVSGRSPMILIFSQLFFFMVLLYFRFHPKK